MAVTKEPPLYYKKFKFFYMKIKAMVAIAAIVILAACKTSYKATDTTYSTVAPAGSETVFLTQYPGASHVIWVHSDPSMPAPFDWQLAKWTPLTDKDYLVRFYLDGDYYYAWYTDSGVWIGSSYTVKDLSRTPPEITNTIRNHYPYYIIDDVRTEIQKDKTTYEVELKNTQDRRIVLLDASGAIISEKSISL